MHSDPEHNKNLITLMVGSACGLCKLPTGSVLLWAPFSRFLPSGWGCCYTWITTQHTSFGHPEIQLGQQPGFGIAAHEMHKAQCQSLGFCSFKRPISSASSLRKLQIHRSGSFQVICKAARSVSLSYLPTLSSVSGEEETHSSPRVNHLSDVATSQLRCHTAHL